jgi:hypothetical protein
MKIDIPSHNTSVELPDDMPMDEMKAELARRFPSNSSGDNGESTPPSDHLGIENTSFDKITGPVPGKIILIMDDGETYIIDPSVVDLSKAIQSIEAEEKQPDDEQQDGEPTGNPPAADNQPAPALDYTSNDVPLDPNRLNFEIGLVKNKKTSKKAVLLPPGLTSSQAAKLAKKTRLRVLKQDGDFYLYDPGQISESTLRRQIKDGKNGHALGYGTDKVPVNGVPYAVNTDGHGTLNPSEILRLRDFGQLGFSGVAPDKETATAKIREMGRNDAEIY